MAALGLLLVMVGAVSVYAGYGGVNALTLTRDSLEGKPTTSLHWEAGKGVHEAVEVIGVYLAARVFGGLITGLGSRLPSIIGGGGKGKGEGGAGEGEGKPDEGGKPGEGGAPDEGSKPTPSPETPPVETPPVEVPPIEVPPIL